MSSVPIAIQASTWRTELAAYAVEAGIRGFAPEARKCADSATSGTPAMCMLALLAAIAMIEKAARACEEVGDNEGEFALDALAYRGREIGKAIAPQPAGVS